MDDYFKKFLRAFDRAEKIMVLTGAGISTLSGIPDFRGKDGFYSGSRFWNGYEKADLFNINFFHTHPEVFYQFAREYLYGMLDKTPSIVHHTLAALQKTGKIGTIYTQNIDALHHKAGSTDVGELHGTLQFSKCTKCGERTGFDLWKERIAAGKIPICPCGGIVKPDVVFFEEALDEDCLNKAICDARNADMIWVLGSSLTVQPASLLPLYTRQNGGTTVIVNAGATPEDIHADFRFYDLNEFCQKLNHLSCISQSDV